MPANLENSAVATGLEKVSFHSNSKERQCQRMFRLPHNCTHLTYWQVKVKVAQSGLTLCDPWTVAHEAPPPSMGFSRREYWCGLPFPSPESSRPRDGAQVSHIAGRCFNLCTTREGCIRTFKISYVKRIASPGLMQDTGCLGLVH